MTQPTANVPLWSVLCGQDWTLIAAATKKQAELLMLGYLVAAGAPVDVRWRIRSRKAERRDLTRLSELAISGDTEAQELVRSLLGLDMPAEPDPVECVEVPLFG